MYRSRDLVQHSSDIIDVAAWIRASDDFRSEEGGARDKQTLISPTEGRVGYLVDGHKYLFKLPNRRAPAQFWSEVLAHRIAGHIGIDVPPTHVAVNSLTRHVGALSEYFHGYTVSPESFYRSGGDILQSELRNYNRRGDSRHSFSAISNWCSYLERNKLMVEDWREYWAKAFLLDTLIGNTDRHHDNWGTMWTPTSTGDATIRFSPLFDNGTSLGYEFDEIRLPHFFTNVRLARYVNRGTHQMFWRAGDTEKISHPMFLKKFYDEFPAQRAGLLSRLGISDKTIRRIVFELTEFKIRIPLTQARADAIFKLLTYRRDNLRQMLIKAHPITLAA